jgi:hypothetical protein
MGKHLRSNILTHTIYPSKKLRHSILDKESRTNAVDIDKRQSITGKNPDLDMGQSISGKSPDFDMGQNISQKS